VSDALECRQMVVERDGRTIVTGIDLHVPAGSVTALLGANGAGKTTTIEAIAGLIPIASGDVLIHGERMTKRRAIQRSRAGLATVEQGRTVFKAMTAGDNLRIAPTRSDVEDALLPFPELRRCLDTRAGLLSGGEQQMLTLARALATGPRVLMIDEMSLGLAPIVVKRLLPLIRDLARREQLAVLLVEQFAILALDIADRAYVMRRGTITFDGPALELATSAALLDAAYFGSAHASSSTNDQS
jgi:branched-chain amino acid transport system ATP-binding protein